jgi:hypothetical protein
MNKFKLLFVLIVLNLVFASCNLFSEYKEDKISCVIEVIESAWNKRDGGYASIVNTAIVELMVLAPRETVEWIHSKKEIEEELISKWQFLVFTDFSGDKQNELERLKRSLIKSLENAIFKKMDLIKLKERLIASLKNIKIRKID